MTDTRWESMRDLTLLELQMSTNDISAANMLLLYNAVLKDFSRSCGKIIPIKLLEANYVAGTGIDLADALLIEFVKYILWNDTYPDDTSLSELEALSDEEIHWSSLRIINIYETLANTELADQSEQRYWLTRGDAKTIITLNPEPTTDVWVIGRALYTSTNYPKEAEKVLSYGLKAKILEYVASTKQLSSQGDVNYNNSGMTADAAKYQRKFVLGCDLLRDGVI